MKIMKVKDSIFFLAIVTILVTSSCANLGDSSTELGNGYRYRVDGSNRWISSDHVMNERVYSNVLDYAFNEHFILVLQKPSFDGYLELLSEDLLYRYSFVVDNKDKSKYDENEKRFLKSHLWTDSCINRNVLRKILPNNQSTILDLSAIADSILKNDPIYQNAFLRKENYWIIKKDTYSVLGPFSKTEYTKTKNDLRIDQELKLRGE